MVEKKEDEPYNLERLKHLWELDYAHLAEAPAENDSLKEARYILQVRAAMEARRVAFVMGLATIAMAIATIVMAVTPFLRR